MFDGTGEFSRTVFDPAFLHFVQVNGRCEVQEDRE